MDCPEFKPILAAIRRCAGATSNLAVLQEFCVAAIAGKLPHYNWVGFYMLDPADPNVLVLGPFHGAPTPHVRIPVSEGICGAAVARRATIVVDDVAADPRYLSCSLETRSEIVVPIRADKEIVGEIDIDSHAPAAFDEHDRAFLEECASIVGRFISEPRR